MGTVEQKAAKLLIQVYDEIAGSELRMWAIGIHDKQENSFSDL